jgi:hypothetical protein
MALSNKPLSVALITAFITGFFAVIAAAVPAFISRLEMTSPQAFHTRMSVQRLSLIDGKWKGRLRLLDCSNHCEASFTANVKATKKGIEGDMSIVIDRLEYTLKLRGYFTSFTRIRLDYIFREEELGTIHIELSSLGNIVDAVLSGTGLITQNLVHGNITELSRAEIP